MKEKINHNHTRAHIMLVNQSEAMKFVLGLSNTSDEFAIENFDCSYIVNAKSIVGVICAMVDFQDNMFLVNKTHDGVFPVVVDQYRTCKM